MRAAVRSAPSAHGGVGAPPPPPVATDPAAVARAWPQHVGEEFGSVAEMDVESIIEVADRCADQLCSVLDDVLSCAAEASMPEGKATRRSATPDDDIFFWYLNRYHGSIFAHLGGFFLNEEALSPSDALALFSWVHGYHAQLGRLHVDVDQLTPSLSELARDLIATSSAAFGRQLASMPDEEAFECDLPIRFTPSGRGAADRSSAHETTLELSVHHKVLSYLQNADESLQAAPRALSELLEQLLPELRGAFALVHPRLLAALSDEGQGRGASLGNNRGAELLTSAFNSSEALRELLCRIRERPELGLAASDAIDLLLSDVTGLMRASASRSVQQFMSQPDVAKAASLLFTPSWAGAPNGSEAHPAVRILLDAADEHVRVLSTLFRPALLPLLNAEIRAGTVRAYIAALLHHTAKLPPAAHGTMVSDIDIIVQWCEQTAPQDGSGATGAVCQPPARTPAVLAAWLGMCMRTCMRPRPVSKSTR